jgi:hypothetical protein
MLLGVSLLPLPPAVKIVRFSPNATLLNFSVMANEGDARSTSNKLEAENTVLQEKVVNAESEKKKLEEELVIFRETNAALLRQLDFVSRHGPSDFETVQEEGLMNSKQMSISGSGVSKSAAKAAAAVKVVKSAAASGTNVIVPLHQGDLVNLRQNNDSQRGIVLGDISLRTVGIQPEDPDSFQPEASLRLGDGLFRLCPHFNYRYRSCNSCLPRILIHAFLCLNRMPFHRLTGPSRKFRKSRR